MLPKVNILGKSYNIGGNIVVQQGSGDTVYYTGEVPNASKDLLTAAGFEPSVKKVIATRLWGKPQDFYFYRDGNTKKLISSVSWDGKDYIDLLLPIGNKVINIEFVDNVKTYRLDVNGVK